MKSINKGLAVLSIVPLLASVVAVAQPQARQAPPQAPIEERAAEYRNSVFHTINYNYLLINGMTRGDEVDEARFQQAAKNLVSLSHMIEEGFHQGSPEYTGLSTDAVWEDSEDFFELVEDFKVKAAALASVAHEGLDEATSEFNSLRSTCGGCHRNYRQRVGQ